MSRHFYLGVLTAVFLVSCTLPNIVSAFFFFPFIVPGGVRTATETWVQNIDHTFAYDTTYIRFTAISSYMDADKIANTLRYNPTVTTGTTFTITGADGYVLSVNGLTASQQTVAKSKIEHIYEVVVSNYVDSSGVLRYQVEGNLSPSGTNGSSVTLSSSRLTMFLGQSFALHWANTGGATGNCTLTATGPAALSLPSGSTLGTSGSVTLASGISTAGDYRLTYQCPFSDGIKTASVGIKAVTSTVLPPLTVQSATCYIMAGMDTCEATVAWDSIVSAGTIQNLVVRNVTTQTILATDVRGSLPVTLRYGENIFAITGRYNGRDVSEMTTATAACRSGSTWNGSMCVNPAISDGGWGIVSDIEFFGSVYRGMPNNSSGPFNKAGNTSCQAINFWACDVRQNADPVQLEIFSDGELINTGKADIARSDTVRGSWGRKYNNMPGCMSGVSSHNLTGYSLRTPTLLKDDKVHMITIRATRSDGIQRWVTYNGWNGGWDYPNSKYQHFPIKCAPEVPVNTIDLAGGLDFPAKVPVNALQEVENARVTNAGFEPLATTTRVAIQFDFGADSKNGRAFGGANDMTVWGTVSAIDSGKTVFVPFAPVRFSVTGVWAARLIVDPSAQVETTAVTRPNNASRWTVFSVEKMTTMPTATLDPGSCVVSAGESNCLTSVKWSSDNFINSAQVIQNNTVFSTAAANTAGMSRTITKNNRSFTVRDGQAGFAVTRLASISCSSGVWDDTVNPPRCLESIVRPPVISIVPRQNFVRYGAVVDVDIRVDADYTISCTASGLGRDTERFSHTGTGETTHSFTTEPLHGQQKITVSCEVPDAAPVVSSTNIEVVPIVQEI